MWICLLCPPFAKRIRTNEVPLYTGRIKGNSFADTTLVNCDCYTASPFSAEMFSVESNSRIFVGKQPLNLTSNQRLVALPVLAHAPSLSSPRLSFKIDGLVHYSFGNRRLGLFL